MTPTPMTLSDVEVHFAVWNLFKLTYLGKYSICHWRYVKLCLHVYQRAHMASYLLLKLKDFSRSQAVTYPAKVVMSRKQYIYSGCCYRSLSPVTLS